MVSALGLEPTPEAYVAHLVLCFREVRRVLRDDGVAWCVVGDSFASQGGPEPAQTKWQVEGASDTQAGGRSRTTGRLKQGDLMLIPHRLALALQADGWTCRNDVVWHKIAPMPESVSGWHWKRHKIKVKASQKRQPIKDGLRDDEAGRRDAPNFREGYTEHSAAKWTDCPGCPKCSPNGGYVLRRGSWRHTRAHETVLMLTKGTGYFCDQEKVREKGSDREYLNWEQRKALGKFDDGDKRQAETMDGGQYHYKHGQGFGTSGQRNPRDLLTADELDELWGMFLAWLQDDNPLDVLTPRPESYKKDHYAVYPSTLITPLIRASCPTRCCPECGAAWAPVVNVTKGGPQRKTAKIDGHGSHGLGFYGSAGQAWQDWKDANPNQVLGYRPTCAHDADAIPGTILDPYVGSGTTLVVARELGLNAIGLDLSPAYLDEHARPRIGLTPSNALEMLPLFQEVNA